MNVCDVVTFIWKASFSKNNGNYKIVTEESKQVPVFSEPAKAITFQIGKTFALPLKFV